MNDFGGKLRQAREGRGISLRQIAANTKISVAALEALERNDISKLPGGIFSRAFVRSYAAEVGLDPDQTVREFLDRFQTEPGPEPQVHVPVSDVEQSFEKRQRAAMLVLKTILGLTIVAAIVGAWVMIKDRRAPANAATGPASAAVTPPAVSAPAPPPVAEPTAAAAPATGPMRLEVHPNGPCWVRLVVDGQTVLSRIVQSGERQTVTVKETAVIDVGDAGAFAFTVDGRAGKTLGETGKVASVRITRATLNQILR